MTQGDPARHAAARVEDRWNQLLSAALRRRGWQPRVLAYAGYGGPGWVRVTGRVLAARPREPGEPSDPGEPGETGEVGEVGEIGEAGEAHGVALAGRTGRTGQDGLHGAAAAALEALRLRDGAGPLDREQLRAAALQALRGWRAFISAPLAGTRVWVTVGERVHVLVSDRGGYVEGRVASDLPPGVHEVTLSVVPPGAPARRGDPVAAPVVVVGGEVCDGVVSDIDDTVMVTSLPRPLIAFWNTFVLHEQARRPVPGMADLLTAAAGARPGTLVLYLSTGAWNVAPILTRFLVRHGYPAGPLLLTDWGPTNTGWFRSGREHKRSALRRLAAELPQVRWLLVGDDGQHDPEVYGEFAAEHPELVRAIAIRQLTAAEQVLAHALPVPVPGAARSRAPLPQVRAPDGDGLAHQLRAAGVLPGLRGEAPG